MTGVLRLLAAATATATCGVAALAVAAPATARTGRRPLPVLRDVAPVGTPHVEDLVLTGAARASRALRARAAQGPSAVYRTADGIAIPVTVSPAYTNPALAQFFVTFLGTLPHGAELARLKLAIETPAEVVSACGGDDGVLACYLPPARTMIVPGEQAQGSDAPVNYVMAHEYGHHLAAARSNAPLAAVTYGPKYWSSYERVCSRTADGRLAVSQTTRYLEDPGEGWAETYARLTYPERPWSFTRLLAPDAAAFAAARRDVFHPWTRARTRTWRGRLSAARRSRSFLLRLNLDGALSFQLRGPKGSDFDLALRSSAGSEGRTKARGSDDHLTFRLACRNRATQDVRLTVTRRSGAGSFRVVARYAG